ncbi:MAG TPA: HAD family hydrolase [Gemmatimonadales bacterium]|nr:HAD family hydrolase [Gemmatimonadales bacterium]
MPGTVATRPAVFLDRDGTLVRDPGYLHDPALVELLPGVAPGLAALARAGWPLVVVSNQSGMARGLYGPDAFAAVHARLGELLAPHGVRFAGAYFCPHHPDITGPCDCRKPGVALFEQAARELGLDLAASWMVGDRMSDAEPARRLGGHGLLLTPDGADPEAARARALGFAVAPDLVAAARIIGPGVR